MTWYPFGLDDLPTFAPEIQHLKSMQTELTQLMVRDLGTLKNEISLYKTEVALWKTASGISNSGGNLCLHLIGNLNHFIGSILGKNGYTREREAEFTIKNVPKEQLLSALDETIRMIEEVVPKLSEEQLAADYPVIVLKEPMKTSFFLMYLLAHLNYHLGQINYHRRLTS